MGLDTTHGCWHGGYGGFNLWRECVARAAGIPLMLMEGFYYADSTFGAGIRFPRESVEWASPRDGGPLCGSHMGPPLARYAEEVNEWLPISWESLRPDPLHALLNHSDCDGEIAAEDCAPLADRLEELLPNLRSRFPRWTDEEVREAARRWINGLREAAAADEPVGFH